MKVKHSFSRWLGRAAVFLLSCFGTTRLMRLLMLEYDSIFSLPFAFLALATSAVFSGFVVRRWRLAAPLRCASELGICGGIAGLGLFILFAYAVAYLFTPQFRPL